VVKRRLFKGSVDREVRDELAFHIEMTTRELMAQGMTRAAAESEARRRFGDSTSVNAECTRYGSERDRKERRAEYLQELRQDLGFAVRQLARARGFTTIAVLTLALGIGATATMFSAVDAVLLRQLPFSDPSRVVALHPRYDGVDGDLTPPEFLAFRDISLFEHVAAARLGGGVTIKLGDLPEMVDAAMVTTDYFAVYGVRPQIGRTFSPDEDREGGPSVAILSHRFWMSRFNGDESIINRPIEMDGKPTTIIGIMPASFDYLKNGAKIWRPLALGAADATKYGAHYLAGFALMRKGVTIPQARSAAQAAELGVARRVNSKRLPLSAYSADVRLVADDLVHDYRALLFILLGAVGFVLLIACGNVANLLLARGTVRARELAIRAALGAGRARLLRQMLTESLVLSLGGALVGVGIAALLLRVLRLVTPEDVPRLDAASVDWRVIAFTLLLALVSAIVFGLVPAMRAARPQLQQTLREGGRGSGAARDRLRPVLVGAQVAMTLALLVGAGLLVRSAWQIQHVDPGFEPRGIYTARLVPSAQLYPKNEQIVRLFDGIRDEAARIPGVQSVALTSVVPMSGSRMASSILAEGEQTRTRDQTANLRMTSDGYFATMHIPLLLGRDIAKTDVAESTPVTVVTAALAHMMWPNLSPREVIGKRIQGVPTRRKDLPLWEIVGVVGDLHDAALTQTPIAEMYVPYTQTTDEFWPYLGRSMVVVARLANAGVNPETLRQPLQRAIARIDPSLPIADGKSMDGYLESTLATARMNTWLVSTLGIIALVLAMVGIYGVVSYFVSQRTQEIGVRIALGSTPSNTWQFVVRRGMTPVAVGLAAGIGLSIATSSLLRNQLFGVTARDPVTLVGVAILLVLIAIVAMIVPARRAMRVSPIVALQQ
jgi:putative ABC transport system permease protein